jgi:murein DD-endopeptidase MepM/ murein hydrolase activator NlpD
MPIEYNAGVRIDFARLIGVCLILAGCSKPSFASNETGIEGTPTGIWMRYTTSQPEARTPKLLPTRTPTNLPLATDLPQSVVVPVPTAYAPIPSTVPLPVIDHLCSPLENVDLKDLPRMISDGYRPPPKGSDARHQGVDFAYYHWKGQGPIEGTTIRSVLPGMVAVSEKDSYPFGNVVVIETQRQRLPESIQQEFEIDEGYSLYVLYAHMKDGSPLVELGEDVLACEPVGFVGKTGNTQAAHLHFETRVGPSGLRLAGFTLYAETATEQEKKNYRLWSISGQYLTFDPMRLILFSFAP